MGEPRTGPIGVPPNSKYVEIWHDMQSLLDYPNSLDAMFEAEKTLTEAQRYEMGNYLMFQCNLGFDWGFANAAQRAEAFLNAIGQWKTQNSNLNSQEPRT